MLKNAIWLFIVAVIVLVAFLPSYTQLQDLRQINQNHEHTIRKLIEKNKQLRAEKRLLIEDPDYLEKVAREKMRLIKEGEVVYKIVPPSEESAQ